MSYRTAIYHELPDTSAAVQDITDKFGALLRCAAETGLPDWQGPHNALAAVILMDQFSR